MKMQELLMGIIPTILVLLGLWFFFNFVFKRFNFNGNKKIILVSIFTFISYVLIVALFLIFLFSPKVEDFQSSKWINNEQFRYKMVDDLIDEEVLIAMDTSQVIKTIGKPHRIYTHTWFYEILGRSFFEFYFIYLIITLENNKVVKVEKISSEEDNIMSWSTHDRFGKPK